MKTYLKEHWEMRLAGTNRQMVSTSAIIAQNFLTAKPTGQQASLRGWRVLWGIAQGNEETPVDKHQQAPQPQNALDPGQG
jgi:hypothetical protein